MIAAGCRWRGFSATWLVPRVPDGDFLAIRIGKRALEQKRVGYRRPILRRNSLRKEHAEAPKRRDVDYSW